MSVEVSRFCNFRRVRVHVRRASAVCPYEMAAGDVYEHDRLAPHGMCLSLFHAIYPYYLTLRYGGWFSWVANGGTVTLQCANPDGAVEVDVGVGRDGDDGVVYARVRGVRGLCPHGCREGEEYSLADRDFPFCPHVLGAIIPYLLQVSRTGEMPWSVQNGAPTLHCPDPQCVATFDVERKS